MNAIDRKRAKLYAIGQEIKSAHQSGACGRRGCDCIKRYEKTRLQYVRLLDDGDERIAERADRRRDRA